MKIPQVTSIRPIQMRYGTGEKPVLVECSDLQSYICKYLHTSLSGYKLTCELVGSWLAHAWELDSPQIAFVKIRPVDWGQYRTVDLQIPSFGSKRMTGVMDVTPASIEAVRKTDKVKKQLLKISLFDLWVCNEDRNSNNANLMYNLMDASLVAIDHGCIFNTAELDYRLGLLTCNETILESALAHHILDNEPRNSVNEFVIELQHDYRTAIERSNMIIGDILDSIPATWKVPVEVVEEKIGQLFDPAWIGTCWAAFIDYLKENGYV